jgi:hypothetical protein
LACTMCKLRALHSEMFGRASMMKMGTSDMMAISYGWKVKFTWLIVKLLAQMRERWPSQSSHYCLALFLKSSTKIEQLAGPGGMYEGYIPVFQGNNAGSNADTTYYTSVKDFCK